MNHLFKRVTAGALALILAGSLSLPALADEVVEPPQGDDSVSAELFDVTAGTYSPDVTVTPGERYTLIALPSGAAPDTLTARDLVNASGQALFIGSATANAQGRLTFTDVRLRTAQAAVYYVTGPGLDPAFREATSLSTSAVGEIITAAPANDSSAQITLVDKETDYRYNTGIYSDASGFYDTNNLAPGKYKLRVEKPGYLPYLTDKENDYLDVTDGGLVYKDVDISANVGDVDNNGVRDMADLAALLLYYDRSDAPSGVTADLDYSGTVDAADAKLLARHLATGTAATAAGTIDVTDPADSPTASLRSLSFRVNTSSTVSAAAFSLTYRAEDVQPLSPEGGLISPVDGGTVASCLAAADGFTARLTGWKLQGGLVTLSFAVTADSPRPAGEVARFYYRPVSGTTDSFYAGVFTLPHAAALVGKDTVTTQSSLTYAGSDDIPITSLTIDQKAAGTGEVKLTIPGGSRTTALPLSATGYDGATAYPGLKGVTWSLDKDYEGVSVNQSLLLVTSAAAAGPVTVTARYECVAGVFEDSLTVRLVKDEPYPAALVIDPASGSQKETISAGEDASVGYAVRFLDQYGKDLDERYAPAANTVSWSLSGAPSGLGVQSATGYATALAPNWAKLLPGTYAFTVCAQTSGGLQATLPVELTVKADAAKLILTGPASAVLPSPGSEPLNLTYTVTALDHLDRPVDLDQLDASFTVAPMGKGVDAVMGISGDFTLTITPSDDPAAQAGIYTLTVRVGEVETDLEVELLAPETPTATQAAIYFKDAAVDFTRLTLTAGKAGSAEFTAKLMDAQGKPLDRQNGTWTWSVDAGAAGDAVTIPADNAIATMRVAKTLGVGVYSITITATESKTGLRTSTQVALTVRPVLAALDLTAPSALTIPTGADLRYTLAVTAADAAGEDMTLPEELVWSVKRKGGGTASGVTVEAGVLVVSPDAAPGDITVTVADQDSNVSASADITLSPAGRDSVLTLYRQITIDGKTVQKSASVPAEGDVINVKEGQNVQVTYTAMLVDQITNQATSVPAETLTWAGGRSSFSVDSLAQCGSYTSNILAIADGQSASASVQVNVYPNITDLRLDFGEGFRVDPPYTLGVPAASSKTYVGKLIATVERGGKEQSIPLEELGLSDYELDVTCYYTGVYFVLDKTAHVLRVTVDPVAIQNPMDPPAEGERDTRVLGLDLSYFPGETLDVPTYSFYLEKEKLVLTNAILRRGVGLGNDFQFDTPRADTIATPAGTLSNCYALELLDQYNKPMAAPEDVTWSLTGSPKDSQGNYCITMMAPNQLLVNSYPNLASLRRLRVAEGTPTGEYDLTLSASCAGFTRTLDVHMTVTALTDEERGVVLSGSNELSIPRYYYSYNATTPNDQVNSAPFTAALRTSGGHELDPANYTFAWSVVNAEGKTPSGVSVAPVSGNPSSANVSADRTAQPTGTQSLTVRVAIRDRSGAEVGSGSMSLRLIRGVSVPAVMEIWRGKNAVTRDALEVSRGSTVTRDYTFKLFDQYNQTASAADAQRVTWSIANNTASSGVSAEVHRDNGVPYVRLTVAHPQKSITVKLTASISFSESSAPSGKQTVFATIPIEITATSSGSGDSSGGGGGDTEPPATGGKPARIAISGNSYLYATSGKAASQTYTFTLKDANGKTCSLADQAKVTWSASGLTSGITFNSTSRTLNIAASAPAGVTKVILTAAYSSSVRASMTVTVNISNPSAGAPASIAINGDSAFTATQGIAASRAYSVTLRDKNGVVTTAPAGGITWSISTLTNGTITITFDPKTATITVPAGSKTGTLSTVLTATCGSLKATLPVTITVAAGNGSAATDVTLSPVVNQSGSSGTAALTTAQEQALLTTSAVGGTVAIIPSGGSGLTSLTVSLTAATANAIASQKGQSLRVQTALGTVILSPESLRALAARGGSNVSVTVSNAAGVVGVDFSCGSSAVSLPGAIILSAPASGNVAIRVSGDAQSVAKKLLVENGKIIGYLSGSTQLKLDTRNPSFADTNGHWAQQAIAFTAARELFQGTSATTFDPGGNMTRSMLVTVLHRLEDTPAAASAASFADVGQGLWYTDAVAWANAGGIVQGTGNGFKPNDPVTREQLATILYRYVGTLGVSTTARASLASFPDRGQVSPWASDAVQWAVAEGLIKGTGAGALNPGGYASRAEVSTILERLIRALAPAV